MLFIFIYAHAVSPAHSPLMESEALPMDSSASNNTQPLGFVSVSRWLSHMYVLHVTAPCNPRSFVQSRNGCADPSSLECPHGVQGHQSPQPEASDLRRHLRLLSLLSMCYFLCVLHLVTEVRNMALWSVEWFPIFCLIGAPHCPGRQQKQMVLTHFTDGETVT